MFEQDMKVAGAAVWPFGLEQVYADQSTAAVWSEASAMTDWLDVEVALARAQASIGVLTDLQAEEIAEVAASLVIDRGGFWESTRTVGYPILPLVQRLNGALGPAAGKVHLGATTQDIMDTATALQMQRSLRRIGDLVQAFGDALAVVVSRHKATVMAGRTHGQQAVPTTVGLKFAVYLDELARYRERIREALPRVARISLFGAAGTGASFDGHAAAIRTHMAAALGLTDADVPWHVGRDSIQECGALCAGVAATAGRFGREIADLARTEIGEVEEEKGHLRGASSTMPQKSNPIGSEMIIAYSTVVGSLLAALHSAVQPRHERATGEWQVEWIVLPQMVTMSASSLLLATEVAGGLVVDAERMAANLDLDGGLIMAEAYMMRLAPHVGREEAHAIVYDAALGCRASGEPLVDALGRLVPDLVALLSANGRLPIEPTEYLGEACEASERALATWNAPATRSGEATG